MRMPSLLLAIALIVMAQPSHAHQQPTTLVQLKAGSDQVEMNLHVPLNELELAFGHEVTQRPAETIATWEEDFRRYLVDHIRPVTDTGQPWSVRVLDLRIGAAEQVQSGPFQEVFVRLALTPPAGATLRNFILTYDVIMHQVVTHKALVSVQNDWASGRWEPEQIATIAVNTETARIAALPIRFEKRSWWTGFKAMVALGMHHIREGTDHLLFLIVLLLPAALTVNAGKWGRFGGGRYSLTRLLSIVTAFTIGHSITLLTGAFHWLQLPQQPVEVLIACSILNTAVHAIRPIFPGWEAQVAAAFGLIHGLAFATVLAGLNLPPGPLALSILGFNLGIELMQLFVIAVTVPWLILLSLTPVHPWIRTGGAALAAVAAIGWMGQRITGQSNAIERWMTAATDLAPLGIVLLAVIAIPAYFYTTLNRPANWLAHKEIE